MFKVHVLKSLETLESDLNKMVSELEADNKVEYIEFQKILDTDVAIIGYVPKARLDEIREKLAEMERRDMEELEMEGMDMPVTRWVDEFLGEGKIDSRVFLVSRASLDVKIREWLRSKKGIDEFRSGNVVWEMGDLVQKRAESELRESIPQMKDELYGWCVKNGLKKITKSLMKGYFEERGEWCPQSIGDLLYTKVNLELAKDRK